MVVDDRNLNQPGEVSDSGNKHEGNFHPDLHYQEDGPEAELTEHDPDGEPQGEDQEGGVERTVEEDVEAGGHQSTAWRLRAYKL